MDKSVVVNFDPEIESGFKIGPKDGGYIISFTDEDFMNYFNRITSYNVCYTKLLRTCIAPVYQYD